MIYLTNHNEKTNHTKSFATAGQMLRFIVKNLMSTPTIEAVNDNKYKKIKASPVNILNAINKNGFVYIEKDGRPVGIVAHKNRNVSPKADILPSIPKEKVYYA